MYNYFLNQSKEFIASYGTSVISVVKYKHFKEYRLINSSIFENESKTQ